MLPVSAERVRKLVRELNRSKNRKWNCAVLSFSICITRDGLARQLGAYKHVVRAVWARCGREPVTNDRSNSCARCWSICQEAVDPAICRFLHPTHFSKASQTPRIISGIRGKDGGMTIPAAEDSGWVGARTFSHGCMVAFGVNKAHTSRMQPKHCTTSLPTSFYDNASKINRLYPSIKRFIILFALCVVGPALQKRQFQAHLGSGV